ncbi:MAG: hypothetical protein H6550_06385 [Chitinophagales bacterium]|nr:hypothetical protein [Chitinophagales bacterium]
MITSQTTKVVLLTISFICFALCLALAQGPGFPDAPVDSPFDGGVIAIGAAAAVYGAKKLLKRK